MKTSTTVAALALVAAGLVVVVGAMLPWVELPLGISKAGVEGRGALTLPSGLFMSAVGIVRFARPLRAPLRWITFLASGLLSGFVLLVAALEIGDLEGISGEAKGLVDVGSGLYVTALAGGVGIAASLLGVFAPGSRRERP